jgi:anthranilate synthase/aminodeoxychorismate synthase-like glutamine amidotransferase
MLLLDNHDSFTWNLVELLRTIGAGEPEVVSSTGFNMAMIDRHQGIIFSPGPGIPEEQPTMFKILTELQIRREQGRCIPAVLGVCLGMQAIAIHFGGRLFRLPEVVHGQPRKLHIRDTGNALFAGIADQSVVGLYHSWAVDPEKIPDCLRILAISEDGTIMALGHRELPVTGIQFHPESIITSEGRRFLQNWIDRL